MTLKKDDVGLANVDNTSDKLKPVSDATQAALDAKVAKAGGVLSGDLNIQKGWPSLILSRADGSTSAQLIGQKANITRWSVDLGNSAAESGGNNGSNYAVSRFSDTGAYIDTPLQVLRSTGDTLVKSLSASGNVSVTGNVTTKSLTVDKSSGLTVNGYLPDGVNWYTQVLYFNPAWDNVSLQGYHAPNDWAGVRLILGSNSPSVFEFRNGGTLRANGVVLTSDLRVKTDLQRIENALDKVERCCGYTYLRTDLIDEFKAVQPRHMGLIAQDVQAVAPEAVLRAGDEVGTLSINYDALTGLLINAIKELHAEVRAIQERQRAA